MLSPKEEGHVQGIGFLTKREDLQMQEFIDYYENKHVPLICRLAPTPIVYKRRYLVRGEELTKKAAQSTSMS